MSKLWTTYRAGLLVSTTFYIGTVICDAMLNLGEHFYFTHAVEIPPAEQVLFVAGALMRRLGYWPIGIVVITSIGVCFTVGRKHLSAGCRHSFLRADR